ncbi:hypothetical protein DCS_02518 [Drechmeria coniospora]|uniref:Uncharacterized protein n=1 Tax=Drechmeria coniospora TaxID=98403 RepID=A0A151GW94_DRECN|nr:hypothetical protein DCS_02518 [Drechmeria coniospora]KYK61376.1 hypothetical protein DCS_02518 [Drechmeria coniospora]
MPHFARSVTLLLQAYAVSSSVIDPATLAARDNGEFLAPTTCPTDRQEFIRHRDKYKVEALDRIVYACVPSLKAHAKPDYGVVARGDSNSVQEASSIQAEECEDAVRAWGCVHGLDCRFEQNCPQGSHRGEKSEVEAGNCAGKTQEMHCKISANKAAAQEVQFDQVASWIIMADKKTSGKIVVEFGRGVYDFVLFDSQVHKDVAGIPMDVPAMFGGKTTFSPQQLMGLDVKLHYSQVLRGSLYASSVRRTNPFKIKSFIMVARLAGTNLVFETTPLIDLKVESFRSNSIIWTGNVNYEGWSADTGENLPSSNVWYAVP